MKKEQLFLLMLIGLLISGCKSEYTKAVEQGLNSGLVKDSLIFGMRMGQTKKDFYSICWDLNKQQLISEGPGNMTAKFTEKYDSTKVMSHRKDMLFFAIFDQNDTIRGMDMTYSYTAWAPWNKNTENTILVEELKEFYTTHYPGNTFFEFELGIEKYKAFVKIDGNRQIVIYPKSAREVKVRIEDLRYKIKTPE